MAKVRVDALRLATSQTFFLFPIASIVVSAGPRFQVVHLETIPRVPRQERVRTSNNRRFKLITVITGERSAVDISSLIHEGPGVTCITTNLKGSHDARSTVQRSALSTIRGCYWPRHFALLLPVTGRMFYIFYVTSPLSMEGQALYKRSDHMFWLQSCDAQGDADLTK